MSEGRPSFKVCGVSAKVRAFCSVDLDSHVSFIRKSLGDGKSYEWVASQLGITAGRLQYYAKKMRIYQSRPHSLTFPRYPGTGPIGGQRYDARRRPK